MRNALMGMAASLTAAGLASAPVSAEAQDALPGISTSYISCMERAGTNTVQSGICTQTEMASQDARLNKAYQQVMRQLARQPAKRIALRDEERSWLKARDYECKVDQQTINNGCLVTKTAMRANDLESRIRF